MRMAIWLAVLLASSFVWAQSNRPGTSNEPSNNSDHGQVTVSGCVGMMNGDYVLIKQDPGNTYQLQGADKVHLRSYLGKSVEITGTKSPTLSTSEDALNRMGDASPVTINVQSIKTIAEECRSR